MLIVNKFSTIFSLMTNWRFNRGVEEQTKAFLDGFSEVVPLQWLQYFDEREIEVRYLEKCLFLEQQQQKKHIKITVIVQSLDHGSKLI